MESKEELPGPVILDVEPISCSMTITRSRDPEDSLPDSISMRLRLARRVEVSTSDERSLNKAAWSITLYENGSGNEFTKLHNAIGLINYYEPQKYEQYDIEDSAETCSAWANVDSQTFNLVRGMALNGKLPAGMRLYVYGIAYGWAPDGSEKVWDVKAHRNAPISKIEINANLVKVPEPDQSNDDADSLWTEPVRESPELLATRAMAKTIEQVNTRLGWIVGLLAATVLVVIFR